MEDSKYNLEQRTFEFAKATRKFLKSCPKNLLNMDDFRQLVRSSGSVGANYIEANESLSRKDYVLRVKICRKEAKESQYWLKLLDLNSSEKEKLILEAGELMRIFGSILEKCKL